MKTILAISAAVLAATPALAFSYATRTWGDESCRLFRQGYGLERGIKVAGDNVGTSIVLAADTDRNSPNRIGKYVMQACLADAMAAYDRDR